jgi:3-dehydroquinate synthase
MRAVMSRHDFQIPEVFRHRIVYTRDAFAAGNAALAEILRDGGGRRAIAFLEASVAALWPGLVAAVQAYFSNLDLAFCGAAVLPGGEAVKTDDALVRRVWQALDTARIDRHSYVLAIGGGAFLDAVGFAAATAHRGVRLLRFPTTTLSQDDGGVGVKCAINGMGKKNWIGTFAVPFAVINDFEFLRSQDPQTCRAGLIEAVKVALVKDAEFFGWIEAHLAALATLEVGVIETCVERSALLHARHIASGGDAFESGSSRPLDFGHWAAHKLESLTGHEVSHAQAVAVGLALDTLYSVRSGLLATEAAERILRVLDALGLATYHPALASKDATGRRRIFGGLDEFRQHLGGQLTVLLLQDLGVGVNVHHLDEALLDGCIEQLRQRAADTAALPHRSIHPQP